MLLRPHLRTHFGRAFLLCLLATFVSLVPMHLGAQDNATPEKHGRKYKAPPETSHIEVTVLKGFNKKPLMNAAVIFHPVKDGVDEGNMEMKTDPDGKAVIDVIPMGSKVTIQIIADGFATFAEDYVVNEASRQIVISLTRPKAQVSTYIDNNGKPSELKPGVQDPIRPKTKPASSTAPTTATAPAATTAPATTSAPAAASTTPQP